ncbi:OsmC family peroxiredoxin [Bacteroidales bacterium OttesenSCG-928-B11]|nr:OsmC family peroxiredoxin [Bacteroidales bacterium OttesenSCG-928-C03]MDL2311574.1 OsmC family peroxiredoxin [Bacteroidales bacterium OttesenSCG-928-B11]MDL2326790.1 OsmC family peroxiredoxin [Bacteroidales bacterium OttesenSCG-928-A14]
MEKPRATAIWNGTGKTGKGTLTTLSGALSKKTYSFRSRTEDTTDTNPEELLAAAHAGCFTMKLAFLLDEAGFKDIDLETNCEITFVGGEIRASDLIVTANIPGISKQKFDNLVKLAETECPVSKLFKAKISAAGILK